MTDREPHCCHVAQEADTIRWTGAGCQVALYIDGTGVVQANASYCPFCGAPLPPKDHPMRQFCPDEVIELYDDAMKRAQEAEQANIRLRQMAAKLKAAHDARQFANVGVLVERIAGPEGSPSWQEPVAGE